jgi:hypothetical protein
MVTCEWPGFRSGSLCPAAIGRVSTDLQDFDASRVAYQE